ncbi:MAG: undecaprenyl-phosphate glucose phosphotransferase [Ignavibacteriales bacterium]|nr:undecaprenyl-phosphate glucose phosphotransferase [Ignavibacteriales bacterium]
MSKPRRNDILIPFATVLSDIVALESAFLLSYWLRFYSPLTHYFEVTLGIPSLESYIVASAVFIPVFLLVFRTRAMYGTRRNIHLSDEFFVVVRLITIGMLIMMSATFFYREFSFSRGVFILLWLTSIVTVSTGRYLIMELEKSLYRRGKELKSVVIVGKNKTAEQIARLFMEQPVLGYEVLGYYADGPAPDTSLLARCRYLGTIQKLPDDIVPYRIQSALIALTHNEQEQLITLLQNTEGKNIEFMMVPDILELMTSRVRIQEIEGLPFIRLKDIPLTSWNRVLKRAFDVLFSIFILVLTLPIMALMAAIIKLTSPGPVFYIQERIGLDERSFSLIKFRSMRIDAEQQSGPLRAKKNDNRTTTIGKILRRTSLDELPQFWNVLRGDMSVVGPRPERPFFVEQFRERIPRYLERHRVKTGMTGWAQVNGLRGDAPIEERTKYDIYYVENWSLVFDLKIIFKTLHAVVFGKDAY